MSATAQPTLPLSNFTGGASEDTMSRSQSMEQVSMNTTMAMNTAMLPVCNTGWKATDCCQHVGECHALLWQHSAVSLKAANVSM